MSYTAIAKERARKWLRHSDHAAFHFGDDLDHAVSGLQLHIDRPAQKRNHMLKQMSMLLPDTLRRCNPAYSYAPDGNPKRVLTKPSEPAFGTKYDNSKHDLIIHVNDIFEPDPPASGPKYRVIDLLGQGTFGQVVKCINLSSGESVAVKVIKNKPAYYNQGLVELKIIRQLNSEFDPDDSGHIVRLRDYFQHHGHLCLVFELLSINLYELIKMNSHRGFSMNLLRIFLRQIIEAQRVLNAARCIHCDLKPENILLCDLSAPHLKVIDFGSACYEGRTVFSYIQSRFYRSPEVILGVAYSGAIDMWSIGCIAAELFFGLPLFPGHSEWDQLARIVEMLGTPPEWILQQGKNVRKYYTTAGGQWKMKSEVQVAVESGSRVPPSGPPKKYFTAGGLAENIQQFPMKAGLTPEQVQREAEHRRCLSHFLCGLLQLDPHRRWTPEQALDHPFLSGNQFHSTWSPAPTRSQAVPMSSGHISGGTGGYQQPDSFSPRSHFQFQLGTSPSTNFSPMAAGFIGQSPSASGMMMNPGYPINPTSPNSHIRHTADRSLSLPTQNYFPGGNQPGMYAHMGPSPGAGYTPQSPSSLYQKQQGSWGNSYSQYKPPPQPQPQYRSQQRAGGAPPPPRTSGNSTPTSPFSPSRSPFKGGSTTKLTRPGGSGKRSHRKMPSTGGNYNDSPTYRSNYSLSDSQPGSVMHSSVTSSNEHSPSPPRHSDGADYDTFYFEDGPDPVPSPGASRSPRSPAGGGYPVRKSPGHSYGRGADVLPDSSSFQIGVSPMASNGFPPRYRAQYDGGRGYAEMSDPTQSYLDPSIFPFRMAANASQSEDPSVKWKKLSRRSANG